MRQLEEHLKKGREVKKNKQGISSVVGSLSDEEQVYGDMNELMGLSQEAIQIMRL